MRPLKMVLAVCLFKVGCWVELFGLWLDGAAPTHLAYVRWEQRTALGVLKEAFGKTRKGKRNETMLDS